jgi:hypothetical protein
MGEDPIFILKELLHILKFKLDLDIELEITSENYKIFILSNK